MCNMSLKKTKNIFLFRAKNKEENIMSHTEFQFSISCFYQTNKEQNLV